MIAITDSNAAKMKPPPRLPADACMIAPISHKSGCTYLGSDREMQRQRLIKGSAKSPQMKTGPTGNQPRRLARCGAGRHRDQQFPATPGNRGHGFAPSVAWSLAQHGTRKRRGLWPKQRRRYYPDRHGEAQRQSTVVPALSRKGRRSWRS